jgi:hypothetical protein
MAVAIKMPPHAIIGITYETPVNRYCLCFESMELTLQVQQVQKVGALRSSSAVQEVPGALLIPCPPGRACEC